jgi:alginate O-acetyltransferase complex protein AlgI
MLGWVLFRADDLPHAARFYAALAGQGSAALQPELLLSLTSRNTAVLCLASLVFALPRSFRFGLELETGRAAWLDAARAALMTSGLAYAGLLLMSGTYNPFLYFRF